MQHEYKRTYATWTQAHIRNMNASTHLQDEHKHTYATWMLAQVGPVTQELHNLNEDENTKQELHLNLPVEKELMDDDQIYEKNWMWSNNIQHIRKG